MVATSGECSSPATDGKYRVRVHSAPPLPHPTSRAASSAVIGRLRNTISSSWPPESTQSSPPGGTPSASAGTKPRSSPCQRLQAARQTVRRRIAQRPRRSRRAQLRAAPFQCPSRPGTRDMSPRRPCPEEAHVRLRGQSALEYSPQSCQTRRSPTACRRDYAYQPGAAY